MTRKNHTKEMWIHILNYQVFVNLKVFVDFKLLLFLQLEVKVNHQVMIGVIYDFMQIKIPIYFKQHYYKIGKHYTS